MKKTMKAGIALAALISTPALASQNLENPLYLPKAGGVYSKTGIGVMYKIADSTDAMKLKNHDGETEFPIWRISEELGVGITDRLAVRGTFGYTHDADIDRKGMHVGRLGLDYRVFDGSATDGWVWDVYADAHLGGISQMTGAYKLGTGFTYDNYSNGRWGFYVGTQAGKTWGKFAGAVFAEILQTFGNHNNEIELISPQAPNNPALGKVNLKSTLEYNAGLKGFYELDSSWSIGGSFIYKHHADNGIKSLEKCSGPTTLCQQAPLLIATLKDMDDGFDEYIVGLSVANKLSETVQIALYGEYTFDTAHPQSQNGTDVKAELGVRLNAQF
jgi:hypothetical protein